MEIEIRKEYALAGYDTGGGTREVRAIIEIDPTMDSRAQRQIAIHETLGCCLDYILSQEQIERLTETVGDVLDQLEGE